MKTLDEQANYFIEKRWNILGAVLGASIAAIPIVLNGTGYYYISSLLKDGMREEEIRSKLNRGFQKADLKSRTVVTVMKPGIELALYFNGNKPGKTNLSVK